MSLRALLFLLCALYGLQPAGASASDDKRKALAHSIPIADVHMHLRNGHDADHYRALMRKTNVAWGGGVGGGPKDDPLRIKRELGGSYIAALGQTEFFAVFFSAGTAGLQDVDHPRLQELFATAESAFRSGAARGFGEIHVNNVSPFSPARGQRKFPLETPVIMKMFEIADRHGGFVQIHTMMSSGSEEIIRMARKFRRTKVILSHCLPGARPDDIAALFAAAPNVFCELSAQGSVHGIRRVFSENGIREHWRVLIEKHPSRFMLGTDPCCGLEGRYEEMIREIRENLLPHLSESTMRAVANGNARRILALK